MTTTLPRPLAAALLVLVALALLPLRAAHGQFGGGGEVAVRAVPAAETVRPGDLVAVAVVFDLQPGWHIWPAAHVSLPEAVEEIASGTRTTITLPDPAPAWATFGPIQWPEPHASEVPNLMGEGTIAAPTYSDRSIAYIPITISPEAKPGRVTLKFEVFYQACNEVTCLMPETVPLSVAFTIDPAAPAPAAPADADLFKGFDPAAASATPPTPPASSGPAASASAGEDVAPPPSLFGIPLNGILLVFLGAVLGGAVLNLTPCVLPIIPIKILTLVQHAGGSRRRAFILGLWMALGVVTFWFVAGLPMAIFSSATADPSRLIFGTWWITLGLGLIIAAMGLGIMGLFTLNLPQSVYMINPKADTPWGSFVFGIMTAVLGLPCFGFVAGGLLAGTAALGPFTIMVIFLGLGVGMAVPYLVLSANPGLVNRIPRTGPASELVKQVMGLLLLAGAAFFIAAGIKALLIDKPWLKESMAWWAVAFFVILAAVWLAIRTLQIAKRAWPKVVMPLLALAAAIGSIRFANGFGAVAREDYLRMREALATGEPADDAVIPGVWLPYTPARLEAARAAGKVVVANFTADWCITCKVIKRTVLDSTEVRARLTKDDVILLEVDVTSADSVGRKFLTDLGRSNVPTLAIFGPALAEPIIYNAYAPAHVLAAVEQAAGAGQAASAPQAAPPTALGPAGPGLEQQAAPR